MKILFSLALVFGLYLLFESRFENNDVRPEIEEEDGERPPALTEEQRQLSRQIREEVRRNQLPRNQRRLQTPLDDVGPNVCCNQPGEGGLQQAEVTIAANILHPDTMIVGSVDFYAPDGLDPWVAFYTTTDGGQTWQNSLLTTGPFNPNAGDPTVAIDANGRMYACYLGFNGGPTRLLVQTSDDNGESWSDPVTVSTSVDKQLSCVDLTPTSPFFGRYYVFWTGSGIEMSYSSDGGETFSNPIQISDNQNGLFVSPTCGPNGEVYATWISTTQIKFDKSLNGGVTWGTDINLGTLSQTSSTNCANTFFRNYNSPVIGCDISNSPRQGWIYVAWSNANIYFRRSEDGGTTWSASARVDDDNLNRLQIFPWLTVHPHTGHIGASWFDWRENVCGFRCYATVSIDGINWEPNFPVSEFQSNPAGLWFIGDYSGNTFANDGKFVAVWTDLRDDDGDCYAAWFSGSGLDAPVVTVTRVDNAMRLRWNPIIGATHYKIFSASNAGGPYATFEGITTADFFDDENAVNEIRKFYTVVSTDEP